MLFFGGGGGNWLISDSTGLCGLFNMGPWSLQMLVPPGIIRVRGPMFNQLEIHSTFHLWFLCRVLSKPVVFQRKPRVLETAGNPARRIESDAGLVEAQTKWFETRASLPLSLREEGKFVPGFFWLIFLSLKLSVNGFHVVKPCKAGARAMGMSQIAPKLPSYPQSGEIAGVPPVPRFRLPKVAIVSKEPTN